MYKRVSRFMQRLARKTKKGKGRGRSKPSNFAAPVWGKGEERLTTAQEVGQHQALTDRLKTPKPSGKGWNRHKTKRPPQLMAGIAKRERTD
jgi:hypothetical protein